MNFAGPKSHPMPLRKWSRLDVEMEQEGDGHVGEANSPKADEADVQDGPK